MGGGEQAGVAKHTRRESGAQGLRKAASAQVLSSPWQILPGWGKMPLNFNLVCSFPTRHRLPAHMPSRVPRAPHTLIHTYIGRSKPCSVVSTRMPFTGTQLELPTPQFTLHTLVHTNVWRSTPSTIVSTRMPSQKFPTPCFTLTSGGPHPGPSCPHACPSGRHPWASQQTPPRCPVMAANVWEWYEVADAVTMGHGAPERRSGGDGTKCRARICPPPPPPL